ncbi:MAG: nuclear transport factor 2 family protein [Cyclobacteriaceae bacterium]
MKTLILLVSITLLVTPSFGQTLDIQSLKDAYAAWIKAWNDRDAAGVAKISWGNFGFGRDVPFPRTGVNDPTAYREGIKEYMETLTRIDYKEHFTTYEIVNAVGLVDGFYAQTTQKENGPIRSVYGRQSLVFVRQDDRWKMVHYHRSALPTEFTR